MVRHYVDNRRPTLAVLLDDARSAYDDAQFEVAVEITTSMVLTSLALRLPLAARTKSEWIMGRLHPQGMDGVLESMTLVQPRADGPALLLAAAELARVESTTSAIAIVTGTRTPTELLPTVTHLRSKVRVIIVVVEPADQDRSAPRSSGKVRITSLPGATVVNVSSLDEFRAGWNAIRA